MQWQIMARYKGGEPEELDVTTSLKDANYLVREYKMAFGPEWTVWKVKQ